MGDLLFVKFSIDGVPVAKGRPRIGKLRNGRPVAYTPKGTRSYESIIAHQAKVAMSRTARGPIMLEGPVKVLVRVYLPIPSSWPAYRKRDALSGVYRPLTRPDLDNFLKIILDGINGIVFKDDSQVIEVRAAKFYSTNPRMEIEIYA